MRRILCVLLAACVAACALPFSSCKAKTLDDCDLQLFEHATGTGDTRDIVSGVVSLGGVFNRDGVTGRVVCVNVGVAEDIACDAVTFESLSDDVPIGKDTTEWGRSVTIDAGELSAGGYVYFAVPVKSSATEGIDVCAYRAFGDVEFRATFSRDGQQKSYRYSIAPTERYLSWVDNPSGNSFDGARFTVTRTED